MSVRNFVKKSKSVYPLRQTSTSETDDSWSAYDVKCNLQRYETKPRQLSYNLRHHVPADSELKFYDSDIVARYLVHVGFDLS